MSLAHFKDVFLHMEWADAIVWKAVNASGAALQSEYILDTFFHIHEAQHSFLDAWCGRPLVRNKRSAFDSNDALRTWALTFHTSATEFLDTQTDEKLQQPFVLPWAHYYARVIGHEPHETTMMEGIHQLVSHSMHHRSQIIRKLRELDMAPPGTDYILWLWSGRPEPDWS